MDQGLPYFHRFVDSFPSIKDLAKAPEDEVLSNWQGLGYYSRARNMHVTAKYVTSELNGQFPKSYAEILKLKGIGPYTAAAISSICFDEPEPVVDGNVFRVVSRLFGIEADISRASSRKVFVDILKEMIPSEDPGTFNQAMMEYGATVCKPSPNCEDCVLREGCFAFNKNRIQDFPVKTKTLKVKNRDLNYLVVSYQNQILLKKRGPKDIWQGMYDFPETNEAIIAFSEPIVHLLSHQKLSVRFGERKVSKSQFDELARTHNAEPFSIKQILTLPKPKVIVDYIDRNFGDEPPN